MEMRIPVRSLSRKTVVLTDGTVVGALYNITVDFKTGALVNLIVKPLNEIPELRKEENMYIIPFTAVTSLKDYIVVDKGKLRM
ncbi:MAG: PRC-barrel domain-containing protein [Archaeoglobus sp.]|jgi:sporulation protein YlmC with PRC-barrel domain|nr:PRC-barrel domain-containing protein [Archaeoglobus sp.]